VILESEHNEIVNLMVKHNPIAHPSVMMRKDALEEHNIRYRQEYILAEDFKMWTEMAQAGLRLHNLPDVLLRYRCSPGQASAKNSARQQSITTVIQYEMVNWLLSLVKAEGDEKAELDRFLENIEKYSEKFFFSKKRIFRLYVRIYTRAAKNRKY